ncbi:hypothetical protein [Chitinibacter tainanensis]|uniref:hypothetical protein n=1 Tax=Chitinibacter tainanensis TaxID=230667 RepID=UPI0023568551|nr:hypothetical protein [Chitinibacter tainanensis]
MADLFLPATAQHRCGHKPILQAFTELEAHLQHLVFQSLAFACPTCCRDGFIALDLNCQTYANLQVQNEQMSAFVLEVSQVISPLDELLAMVGYQQASAAIDEYQQPAEPLDIEHAVWRKEYWFATNASPELVLQLMHLVKQELSWLAMYLPAGKAAVHFGSFMPR